MPYIYHLEVEMTGSPLIGNARGGSDKRIDMRVPIEMFMNEYRKEHPSRVLATNVSETGLYLQKLAEPVTRHCRIVALEFELPGTGEIIWARGESRFDSIDEDFHTTGIRFTAMARKHERLIRDYVFDKHKQTLDSLWLRLRLDRLTRPET